MRPAHLIIAAVVACANLLAASLAPEQVEFFENRIRPILAQECYECHSSAGKQKGGLALDTRDALRKGGNSGPAILPGDPDSSLLLKTMRHELPDLQMPEGRPQLDASILEDFQRWIKMGAPDPRDAPPTPSDLDHDNNWPAILNRRKTWWSFQPIRETTPPAHPAPHPIDKFIRQKLAEKQLTPAPPASKQVFIRRLSFALRGLPPTPTDIEAFLQDDAPQAYDRLVDRFLASPQFGERWARHWLDWYRYADSHGSEGDSAIPYSWRYRDYLIRALNADVPYDQLLREHIAGDQLPNPRLDQSQNLHESALGIAHLRMVFHGFAPTDALEERVRFVDDQINVVSKAALGLTLSCARCHDHKFDPLSQADYTSWYGLFSASAPAIISVDAPSSAVESRRSRLTQLKSEIKQALIAHWQQDADQLHTRLAALATNTASLLAPLRDTNILSSWQKSEAHLNATRSWSFAANSALQEWHFTRPLQPSPAGEFALATSGDTIVSSILPAGVFSHLITTRENATLISPKFSLDRKYNLWVRVAGEGGSVLRYAVEHYPLEGTVYPVTRLRDGNWRWVKFDLSYWEGDRVHVELSTAADQPVIADLNATRSWFGVTDVLFIPQDQPGPTESFAFAQPLLQALASGHSLTEAYAVALRQSLAAWSEGQAHSATAGFLDQALRAGLLRNSLEQLPSLQSLLKAWRDEEAQLPIPVRAPGLVDTEEADQPLFARGDHKQPRERIPRRFLEAFDAQPYIASKSARLQLAEDLTRPDNPLTARVIVNRVWHHLFGRGLVATPDNFGRLGTAPSHPELLDYLATWFVRDGYSLKRLIRFIVITETWQASSQSSSSSATDPDNIFLSHFPVRRLEAEAIRDALLSVSGQLRTETMYGPPILGNVPRRSVYLRVKRNELDPFMAAFDAPAPASTTGKRDVTNVPAQSLLLLNDPYVISLAEAWAKSEAGPTDERVRSLFLKALGRFPTELELHEAILLLEASARERAHHRAQRQQLQSLVRSQSARLQQLENMATRLVRPDTFPKPPTASFASWDFAHGLPDGSHALAVELHGRAKLESGALLLDGKSGYLASKPLTEDVGPKTLEAWVRLDTLQQSGGGVLTLQDLSGEVFDSIVFAEREPGRWLAGSDFGRRSQSFGGPAETEASDRFVHVAIVYEADGTILAYRNGEPYGKPYKTLPPIQFKAGQSQLLIGNRHGAPIGNRLLQGAVRRARLYNRPLSPEEIRASYRSQPYSIPRSELFALLPEKERREYQDLIAAQGEAEAQLKSLETRPGLSSEWADLAHAIFNLKEFVYVQ